MAGTCTQITPCRLEFFQPHEVPATKDEPYLMDFKYIFDELEEDNRLFIQGESVTEEQVDAELGTAEEMRLIAADTNALVPLQPPGEALTRIEEILTACHAWRMTDDELAELS